MPVKHNGTVRVGVNHINNNNDQQDELDVLNRCDSLQTHDCLDFGDGGIATGDDRGDETWLMASANHIASPPPYIPNAPSAAAATPSPSTEMNPTTASSQKRRRGGTATGTSSASFPQQQQQQQQLRRHSSLLLHAKHNTTNQHSAGDKQPSPRPNMSLTAATHHHGAGTSPSQALIGVPHQRSPSASKTPPPFVLSRSPSEGAISTTPQPRRQLFNYRQGGSEKDAVPPIKGHHATTGSSTAREPITSSSSNRVLLRGPSTTHLRSSSAGNASSSRPASAIKRRSPQQNTLQQLHKPPTTAGTNVSSSSLVRASPSPPPIARTTAGKKAGVVVLSLQPTSTTTTSHHYLHSATNGNTMPPSNTEATTTTTTSSGTPQGRTSSSIGRGSSSQRRSPSLGEGSASKPTSATNRRVLQQHGSSHDVASETSPRPQQPQPYSTEASTPPKESGPLIRRLSTSDRKKSVTTDHEDIRVTSATKANSSSSSTKQIRRASAAAVLSPVTSSLVGGGGARCVSPAPPRTTSTSSAHHHATTSLLVADGHNRRGELNAASSQPEDQSTAKRRSTVLLTTAAPGETLGFKTKVERDIMVELTLLDPEHHDQDYGSRTQSLSHNVDVHLSLLPDPLDETSEATTSPEGSHTTIIHAEPLEATTTEHDHVPPTHDDSQVLPPAPQPSSYHAEKTLNRDEDAVTNTSPSLAPAAATHSAGPSASAAHQSSSVAVVDAANPSRQVTTHSPPASRPVHGASVVSRTPSTGTTLAVPQSSSITSPNEAKRQHPAPTPPVPPRHATPAVPSDPLKQPSKGCCAVM